MNTVIVFLHSLGSLWQRKDLPDGGARLWNTTGVVERGRVRSCATTFGQLQFGPRASLHRENGIAGASWIASAPNGVGSSHRIRLCCRAPRSEGPDWFLVVLTEALVGQIELGGIDPINAVVVSASRKNEQQELMLLVRPFAWVSGSAGSAVWSPNGKASGWSIAKW